MMAACIFLSTLSLRRATSNSKSSVILDSISIHALLAESDENNKYTQEGYQKFLSTLSLRRATVAAHTGRRKLRNFYPRSPCGERLINTYHRIFGEGISIHALLAESDSSSWSATATSQHFYPRSPCGERRLLFSSTAGTV